MESFTTTRIAAYGLLVILALAVLFHGLVLLGVIPFGIVWGGRLDDYTQMFVFETISVTLNLLMLTVVAIYAGILKVKIKPVLIKGILWAMFVIFLINTIGNALSNNEFEQLVFTPLTLLLSLFSLRLAASNYPSGKTSQ